MTMSSIPEQGLITFIRNKLDQDISYAHIKRMLLQAGIREQEIDNAYLYVHNLDVARPKREPAGLGQHSATASGTSSIFGASEIYYESVIVEEDGGEGSRPSGHVLYESFEAHAMPGAHGELALAGPRTGPLALREPHGLFRGRLLRRDFILGFLFFFGIGYITLSMVVIFISLLFPALSQVIVASIDRDASGLFFLIIPILLAPITCMMLSIIARRLHNIGLPGVLSLTFLAVFIPPSTWSIFPGLMFLDGMIVVLFIVLLTKKGSRKPNRYGPYPDSRGSFFRRIFNV